MLVCNYHMQDVIVFLPPAGFHEALHPQSFFNFAKASDHYQPYQLLPTHYHTIVLYQYSSMTVGTMSLTRKNSVGVIRSLLLLLCGVMMKTYVHATPYHHHHKGIISVQTALTPFHHGRRSPTTATTAAAARNALSSSSSWASLLRLRGGGSVDTSNEEDETTNTTMQQQQQQQQDGESQLSPEELQALQSYRMQQQILLQLRATYLGEALARRGLPMTTVADVSTPEGASPPQPVDWDCAMSTETNPMSCLFSFDAEPGTKVVAPLGTTHWIGLATLNRLRRQDPTKVEPMWHSKYAILKSWFDDPESDYSFLPHVGFQGFVLNALLQGVRLPIVVGVSLTILTIVLLPVLEYFVNRLLVSSFLWSQWTRWYRFVHAALPLKLFLGQMIYGYLSKAFSALTRHVKDILVEQECALLEQCLPLTVGVPDWIPPTNSRRRKTSSSSSSVYLDVDVEEGENNDDDDPDDNDDSVDEDLEDEE